MSKPCSSCRTKKIRCDGGIPICGPCTKARKLVVECVYVAPAPQTSKAELLQKGAACTACRRKKKKCDAKRPFCTTCTIAEKEDDCHYEDGVHQSIRQTLTKRIVELEHRLKTYESSAAPRVSLSTSSHGAHPSENLMATDPESWTEPFPDPLSPSTSLVACDFPLSECDTESSNASVFASPTRDNSPLEFPDSLPISGLHDEMAQSMGVDVSLPLLAPIFTDNTPLHRMVFLTHRLQLGLCIPDDKVAVIYRGDMSGCIVHPVLIHVAQMWGSLLCWQDKQPMPSLGVEGGHLGAALELLSDRSALSIDPATSIQAHCLISLYFFTKLEVHQGCTQLAEASDVVTQYNLKIARQSVSPSTTVNPHINENITAALCQLLYLDKCCVLLLELPTAVKGDLDQGLHLLPSTFPSTSSTSIAILKVRSILFIQEARRLSSRWREADLAHTRTTQWYDKYWELMRSIRVHLSDVKPAMLKATFCLEKEKGIVLKLCQILSLTALAELHYVLAPSHPESRRECTDAAIEIANTTDSFRDEDFNLLDPVLTVCWAVAARILEEAQQSPAPTLFPENIVNFLTIIHRSVHKLGQVVPYVPNK